MWDFFAVAVRQFLEDWGCACCGYGLVVGSDCCFEGVMLGGVVNGYGFWVDSYWG